PKNIPDTGFRLSQVVISGHFLPAPSPISSPRTSTVNTAKRRLYVGTLKIFNLGLMIFAFGITTALQVHRAGEGATLSEFFAMRVKLTNFGTFVLILLIWHLIFSLCGQYRSQRLSTRRLMLTDATIATTIASFFLGSI